MNFTPEWIAVGLSIIVAIASAVQIWQNTNIKLAVSKVETNIESRFGEIREWTRTHFVSKEAQMNLLELLGHDDKKNKVG